MSNSVLARKAQKRGVNIGFVPGFTASLVSYMITVNPHVENSDYLRVGLQMLAIIFVSIVWASFAMLVVAAGVFLIYRLNGD
ncbi:MAG: hypothetical protein ABSD49_13805 [Candidatus Bathyarchaeia archaeon]|jgi:uncharacterized PurR-regulated membrane protein YhhQ (DUF165 family)